MIKKLLSRVAACTLSAAMILSLSACAGDDGKNEGNSGSSGTNSSAEESGGQDTSDVKIGMILIGDENEGYTFAHIDGAKKAAEELGIAEDQIVFKYNVDESAAAYDAAADLVDEGCNLVISNSYGHQSYMQQAAAEFTDVKFVSMTGDTANQVGMQNFSNAFTHIFESRYVSGVVAGMKLAELEEAGKIADKSKDKDGNIKVGYVGAYPYAEVVSGYTAFYLGIKSVVENVTMEVQYTNSWFDITAEGEAAKALMSDGCVIIGQHADSTGAPSAVQEVHESGEEVYSVGYNVSMLSVAPDAALTSSTNNWTVYYRYAFECMLKGENIATDWAKGYSDGAVGITALGSSCADGTAEKVAEVEEALKAGSLHVFDTSKFTVDGKNLDSYFVDLNGDFACDEGDENAQAIKDGYFHESELRAAPSFDIRIDGITELNAK